MKGPADTTNPDRDAALFWERLALDAVEAPTPADALNRAMESLARFHHADRAWIGRYNQEITHFWGVADWVSPGVPSHLQEIQGVPVEALGEAHQRLLRHEIMAIPDVEKMSRQNRVLQAELRREGVRSTFAYPLVLEDRLIGFFGIDHVQARGIWSDAELPSQARYLAALLQRSLAATPPPDLPAAEQDRSVYVSEGIGQSAVSLEELIYIQADGDYGRLYLSDGRSYFERRSLRSWVSQLPRERFVRVHQSYLVNSSRITRLDRGRTWNLHLQGVPAPIPVGRVFRHALRLHLGF
jgi:hypothetical protein